MKKPLFFIALLLALPASAANWVTATFTPTNVAVAGDWYSVNGNLRTGGVSRTSTTFTTNLTSTAGTATNIYSQFGGWPVSGALISQSSNVLTFRGIDLTFSNSSFGSLTLSTNASTTNFWALNLPFNVFPESVQKSNASALVTGIAQATNSFAEGATPLANYASLTATQTLGNKVITNVTLYHIRNDLTNVGLTDARMTNFTGTGTGLALSNVNAHTVTITNLSVPGEGVNSIKIGADSSASGDYSVALGDGAVASEDNSIALGGEANAGGIDAIVIGTLANSTGNKSIAIGYGATIEAENSIAIGYNNYIEFPNSIAIGINSGTTTSNQVAIGTLTDQVYVPGQLQSGTITNSTFTGTNQWQGDISFSQSSYTGLVNAPTDNEDIPIGTNQVVLLSGATTIAEIHSFEDKRDGYMFRAIFSGAVTNSIVHDSGAVADTTIRINTGQGAGSVVHMTNNPSWAVFYKRSTDWLLLEHSN